MPLSKRALDTRSARLRPAIAEQSTAVRYSSGVAATGRVVLYVLWNLLMVPVQALAVLVSTRLATRIPVIYHRNCLRAMGTSVSRHGRVERSPSTLYVANHSSYLDITILGSLLPVGFVAKSEIRDWPIFGILARLQRSVFVDRRPANAKSHAEEIADRLNAGDSLVLFPEGTSGEGNHVLRFKSALFSVAQIEVGGRPVTVQPVTVAYSRLDGMPMGRHLRPFFTWFGDMDIMSHMGQMFGMGRLGVDVIFHEPVRFDAFGSRKAMSDYCAAVIAQGLSDALSGRLDPKRKSRARQLLERARERAAAKLKPKQQPTDTAGAAPS
ncbi:MAG: lysophospholipid acyltransferase family protein [Alphaproteobacteria bacterium]